ncbi:MAG: protein kinase [Polyangiaceae bacterium]
MSNGPLRRLGPYWIGRQLGAGGMGAVHLAMRVADGDFTRVVVAKRVLEGQMSPSRRKSILREARLASRLRHANVVPSLDVLTDGDDVWVIFEYVEGESLLRLSYSLWNRDEAVPLEIAAAIVIQVLDGLGAAHDAVGEDGAPLKIVHRDVSPHNVIVGTDGVARITDFGIASASGESTTAADAEHIKGKVAYLAPEQLRGRPADHRADLYASGVLLWELIAGRHMLEGAATEVLFRAMDFTPVAPSTEREGAPTILDAVVLRALSRSPEDRYPTADAMARAIEEVVRPASARTVAAWVKELAGPALALRARAVSELNEGRAPGPPAPRDSSPRDDAALEGPAPASTAFFDTDRKRVVGRRLPWLTIGLGVLAAGLAISLVVVMRNRGPSRPDLSSTSSGDPQSEASAVALPSTVAPTSTSVTSVSPPLDTALSASASAIAIASVSATVTSTSVAPVTAVAPAPKACVTDMSVGALWICARRTDDKWGCIGANDEGQLARRTAADADPAWLPIERLEKTPINVAGCRFPCALTQEGEVYCWGSYLGTAVYEPTKIPFGDSISELTFTGDQFTCARGSAGVSCWSNAPTNGLTGTSVPKTWPPATMESLAAYSSLAFGYQFGCGVRKAEPAIVDCWGLNDQHQLGLGDVTPRDKPTALSAFPSNVVKLASTDAATCALLSGDDAGKGAVYCWGGNSFYESASETDEDVSTPKPVAGLSQVIDIATGQGHFCALDVKGSVQCWGNNLYGQLGRPKLRRGLPMSVQLPPAKAIRAAINNSCALTKAGLLYCWGDNTAFQLGARFPTPCGGGNTPDPRDDMYCSDAPRVVPIPCP